MSGSISSGLRATWEAIYQTSPIFLVGGSFAGVPGGIFPLAGLASSLLGSVQSLASGGTNGLSFGKFIVIPGGNLVNQAAATYPFANQQVAANATVQQPLSVSMLLRAPVNDSFGYLTKLAIFSSLKSALTLHNNSGGTYTIMTPASIYENGLLLNMTDVTSGEGKQVQVDWQLDFYFSLITQQQATNALNTAMTKLAGGQPVSGPPTWQALGL